MGRAGRRVLVHAATRGEEAVDHIDIVRGVRRGADDHLTDLARLADAILAGKRHPKLAKNVMFFHVAGMKFPYKNMRYVHVGGGNTFYYKASRRRG